MSLNLHFSQGDWQRVELAWSAWWAGELERPLVVLECIDPQLEQTPHYASTFLGNYGLDLPADELLEIFIPRLQATHTWGTPSRASGPTLDRGSWLPLPGHTCTPSGIPPGSHQLEVVMLQTYISACRRITPGGAG